MASNLTLNLVQGTSGTDWKVENPNEVLNIFRALNNTTKQTVIINKKGADSSSYSVDISLSDKQCESSFTDFWSHVPEVYGDVAVKTELESILKNYIRVPIFEIPKKDLSDSFVNYSFFKAPAVVQQNSVQDVGGNSHSQSALNWVQQSLHTGTIQKPESIGARDDSPEIGTQTQTSGTYSLGSEAEYILPANNYWVSAVTGGNMDSEEGESSVNEDSDTRLASPIKHGFCQTDPESVTSKKTNSLDHENKPLPVASSLDLSHSKIGVSLDTDSELDPKTTVTCMMNIKQLLNVDIKAQRPIFAFDVDCVLLTKGRGREKALVDGQTAEDINDTLTELKQRFPDGRIIAVTSNFKLSLIESNRGVGHFKKLGIKTELFDQILDFRNADEIQDTGNYLDYDEVGFKGPLIKEFAQGQLNEDITEPSRAVPQDWNCDFICLIDDAHRNLVSAQRARQYLKINGLGVEFTGDFETHLKEEAQQVENRQVEELLIQTPRNQIVRNFCSDYKVSSSEHLI